MTAKDFTLDKAQRRLFPFVERSFEPETSDGFAIPGAQTKIRENIRYLFRRVLDEEHRLDSAEVERAYALFHDTWTEGKALLAADEAPQALHYYCRAERDPLYLGRAPGRAPDHLRSKLRGASLDVGPDLHARRLPFLVRIRRHPMDRRDFMKLASLAGVSLASPLGLGRASLRILPWRTRPTRVCSSSPSTQAAADPTSLCDPKGRADENASDPMNMYFTGDIRTAGNIQYAPVDRFTPIFEKYHQRLVVFNGIDTSTNGHMSGTRHIWSGNLAGNPKPFSSVRGRRRSWAAAHLHLKRRL